MSANDRSPLYKFQLLPSLPGGKIPIGVEEKSALGVRKLPPAGRHQKTMRKPR